jgi:hypothetical protein
MTGRMVFLIKQYGKYDSIPDVHSIYEFLENNFDIETISNEQLISSLPHIVKENNQYIWDIFKGGDNVST